MLFVVAGDEAAAGLRAADALREAIISNGMEVKELPLESETTVETICLLRT